MAKVIPDAILDAMLNASEGSHMAITSAEPANYAGIAAVTLAGFALAGAPTAGAGDTSGRKNTYGAETGKSITASGTATHVVTHNNTDTMYVVTTCTSQALTSGGTVDTNAWDHELNDPT